MIIGAIIQARLGSERLPNKVLMKIPQRSRYTCLDRVIQALKKSTLLDEIILTTPDALLVKEAIKNNIKYILAYGRRNVLKEYHNAAERFNLDIIVRITADCPLLDTEIVEDCIDFFLDGDFDLVYNTDEDTGQLNGEGSDVEVFSKKALTETYLKATLPEDKEHVTKYMRRTMKTAFVPSKKLGIKSLNTFQDYEDICQIWLNEKEKAEYV